jgi:hypothetical protein
MFWLGKAFILTVHYYAVVHEFKMGIERRNENITIH